MTNYATIFTTNHGIHWTLYRGFDMQYRRGLIATRNGEDEGLIEGVAAEGHARTMWGARWQVWRAKRGA